MTTIDEQIIQLRAALPLLEEKAKLGVIHFDSHVKARDLLRWHELGRTFTDKQVLFIGRLLQRAKRKHRDVKVEMTAGVVDEDALVAKVLAKVGENKVDVDAVVAAVQGTVDTKYSEKIAQRVVTMLDERVPRKVEIVVSRDDGKKVTKNTVRGPVHRCFERLMRAATSKMADGYAPGIFLQGEASSGKTTGARMLAEALKLDWHYNGAISMPHEMLGFIDGHGKYHTTPFRRAYENGGVYTFDEVDRSDPVALLAVNPHLANGVATFPDKQIKRHKDCIIVCTANTWGLGADANYSGATKLDAAFLSRFPVRINWDIDPDLESLIVPNAEWLSVVRRARERARTIGLKVMIDTRIAQAGAALIASGYSVGEASEMTFLANLKPDQRQLLQMVA